MGNKSAGASDMTMVIRSNACVLLGGPSLCCQSSLAAWKEPSQDSRSKLLLYNVLLLMEGGWYGSRSNNNTASISPLEQNGTMSCDCWLQGVFWWPFGINSVRTSLTFGYSSEDVDTDSRSDKCLNGRTSGGDLGTGGIWDEVDFCSEPFMKGAAESLRQKHVIGS